jgi:hypothetical protein
MDGTKGPRGDFGIALTLEEAKAAADQAWKNSGKP